MDEDSDIDCSGSHWDESQKRMSLGPHRLWGFGRGGFTICGSPTAGAQTSNSFECRKGYIRRRWEAKTRDSYDCIEYRYRYVWLWIEHNFLAGCSSCVVGSDDAYNDNTSSRRTVPIEVFQIAPGDINAGRRCSILYLLEVGKYTL